MKSRPCYTLLAASASLHEFTYLPCSSFGLSIPISWHLATFSLVLPLLSVLQVREIQPTLPFLILCPFLFWTVENFPLQKIFFIATLWLTVRFSFLHLMHIYFCHGVIHLLTLVFMFGQLICNPASMQVNVIFNLICYMQSLKWLTLLNDTRNRWCFPCRGKSTIPETAVYFGHQYIKDSLQSLSSMLLTLKSAHINTHTLNFHDENDSIICKIKYKLIT